MTAERLERWLDRTEIPMLALAVAAVAAYLADLAGIWTSQGLDGAYSAAAVTLDLLFVADLVAKLALGRGSYLRSPWFLVDLVCTLPILASLAMAPSALQGLRFVRAFRVLRVLRGLRSLWFLRLVSHDAETVEQRRFNAVLAGSVTVYSVVFVALVTTRRDPEAELYLVLGSLLGMLLVLVVARFQIPALWSRQMRALLNIALPAQVAEWLLAHPDDYDHTVRAAATVIFCDIKGFTASVERLALDDVKRHLEQALDAVVEAHVAQDLIIDKYIGDAVMSFRGGNLVPGTAEEHAWRVVRGALDAARALTALNDPWFTELKIGGASAPDALIGTFGTSKRLSYTILGDRVNLAARLEASCNGLGVRNLFCDRTHALLADRAELVWRRVGAVRVQGKDEAVEVYEVYDAAEAPPWLADYHRALERFEAREFAEAGASFAAVDDRLSALYAELCRSHAADGVALGWRPVLVTRK